jgi:hypothetical protein
MIAAYLLEQAALHPDKPLPVKFGIFASPPPVLATDKRYIESVYGFLSEMDLQRLQSASLDEVVVHLAGPARTSATLLVETLTIMKPVHGRSLSYFFDRPASEIPCVLLPHICAVRLGIPTLHVLGKQDPTPLQRSSEICRGFCDPSRMRVFRHSAVHGLPRESGEVREFVEFIMDVSQMSGRAKL